MDAAKAVLITGASTGIGRQVTEYLATRGYFVYAGARRDSDIRALNAIDNVQAIKLDITSKAEIAQSVDLIGKGTRTLYGLVNNAGVLALGSVVRGSEQEFGLAMAVNVRGTYEVTRAFAPLIIGQRGRVVFVSSIAGLVANRNFSPYSVSKHAIEALADSLALDMDSLGVWVSIVEPGGFNTEIGKNAIERVGADPLFPDFSTFRKPDDVVDAIASALLDVKPKRRYLVAPSQEEAQITIRHKIEQLVQLNEGHRYTYDRNSLIRMLDEALAQPRS